MEPSRLTVVAISATLLGILICFFGYRLLRFTLVVVGLALGAYLGSFIALTLNITVPVTAVIVIVLSIVGALLMSLLLKLGIFLLGAAGALLLARTFIGTTAGYHLLIKLLAGVVGGVLALLISRPVLCLLTAFIGSWSAVTGIFSLLMHNTNWNWRGFNSPVLTLSWVGLAIVGFLIQISARGKRKHNTQPTPR